MKGFIKFVPSKLKLNTFGWKHMRDNYDQFPQLNFIKFYGYVVLDAMK